MLELSWSTLVNWLLGHGTRIVIILALGAVMWFALRKFLPLLLRHAVLQVSGESAEAAKKRRDTLLSVFTGVARVLVVVVISFMVLSELQIPIGPIMAGFGIAGVAVGFGAQYLIRDLIAGIFIVMENQYRVGDVARVADTAGLVQEVTLRKTVLRDLDGIVHHVPNGEIRIASNFTREYSRVNLNVPVSYGTDLDHAITVINRVGNEMAADEKWKDMMITPPQVLRVDNFGDSGIDIKVLGDVKPIQQWAVMGELRLRLKKAFDAEGIEIPWPHTKIFFGDALKIMAGEHLMQRLREQTQDRPNRTPTGSQKADVAAGGTGPLPGKGALACPQCRRESPADYIFCPGCGAPMQVN